MHHPAIHLILAVPSDLTQIGLWASLLERPDLRVLAAVRHLLPLEAVAEQYQPDVVIVSEGLDPEYTIFEVLDRLMARAPASRPVVLGERAQGLLVGDLLHAGVQGYLYSGDDLSDCLTTALDTVMRGRTYLSPTAKAEYRVAQQSPQRDWHLDAEARAVLRLLAAGTRVCEIASELCIPQRRVYWVRQKLRHRFGAETNEQLISLAASEGFILT